MTRDAWTDIGGEGTSFSPTRWSVVMGAARAESPQSREDLERLLVLYWKPVYAFIRRKWRKSNDAAKDLTQAFFADLLKRPFLDNVAPEKGRFRTFLRACLENFIHNQNDADRAAKRGGNERIVSLDDLASGDTSFDEPSEASPEDAFDREWKDALLRQAVTRLSDEYSREERPLYFQVFKAYDLSGRQGLSYADLAASLGMKETDVSNFLAHARKRFRALVEELVAETVSSPSDLQEEIVHLFRKR